MIELDFQREAREFLSRALHTHSAEDRKFIFQAADLISARTSGISFWILVPCYVRETFSTLYLYHIREALREHQNMGVIFFINGHRENHTMDNWERQNAILTRQLQEYFEGSNRAVVLSKYYSKRAAIGRIRGLLCAAVVVSCLKTGISSPYVICNDADTMNVSCDYFEALVNAASQNIKFVCGPVHYYLNADEKGRFRDSLAPELFLFDVVSDAILSLCREGQLNYEKRIWPDGANVMISAAAYCAVGGFDFLRTAAEDDAIGRALHRYTPNAMGGTNLRENTIFLPDPVLRTRFLPSAWIVTNPRRVLESIVRGYLGIEAWSVVPFAKQVGAGMDLEDILSRYATRQVLVQEADLWCLSDPRGNSRRDRAVRRIVAVIVESGKKDFRIRNSEQMARFVKRTGLRDDSRYSIEGMEEFMTNISLDNSPLLRWMMGLIPR